MVWAPVATQYSYEFVLRHLPAGASKILEIGCGRGELAARLQQDGFTVSAIDSDPECVDDARALGISALVGSWPMDIGAKFDAILFTRSLHHIHELDEAIEAALAALRPAGTIIVEDFRAQGATERSHEWFATLVRRLNEERAFREDLDLEAIISKDQPDDHDHDHELHSSDAIRKALERTEAVNADDAAYYFRYLEPELSSPRAAQALLDEELTAIQDGSIDALGKRFVLRPLA